MAACLLSCRYDRSTHPAHSYTQHTHNPQTGVQYIDTTAAANPKTTTSIKELHLATDDPLAEVIVCAGAIETPKLLLLSGIGDPAALRSVLG